MRRWGWVGVLVMLLLVIAISAGAQQLTSSEETITVSTTAIGVTADLCDTGNRGGAYLQVTTNAIYLALNVGATPDSNDFRISSGTTGPQIWVKPASRIRMLRQSADSIVKIQCSE